MRRDEGRRFSTLFEERKREREREREWDICEVRADFFALARVSERRVGWKKRRALWVLTDCIVGEGARGFEARKERGTCRLCEALWMRFFLLSSCFFFFFFFFFFFIHD